MDRLAPTDLHSRSHKRVIVHFQRSHHVGTVLTFFHDHIQDAPPPAAHWTEDLRALLDPFRSWRVYVDGAWRTSPSPTLDHYFLDGKRVGSSCIILMASQADREQAPIIVLPFAADQLDAEHSGFPFQMELLALTGGLQILCQRHLTGKVISDCQSLTRKLGKWDVLRSNTGCPATPPAPMQAPHLSRPHDPLDEWATGAIPHPTIGMVARHVGEIISRTCTRGDRTLPDRPHKPDLTVLPTLPYHTIAQAAIRDTEWQFITNTHIPMLDSPSDAIRRDASRAARGVHHHGPAGGSGMGALHTGPRTAMR